MPVLIQISIKDFNPPSPFKFNPSLLEEEDFVNFLKKQWNHFDASQRESTSIQFAHNLNFVKKVVSSWTHLKRVKNLENLVCLEHQIAKVYGWEAKEGLNETSRENLKMLEQKKRNILVDKEEVWRMKRKGLLLSKGDENTKFFHNIANYRKNNLTIWGIQRNDGTKSRSSKTLLR
jgi:hypothetical protein